MFAYNRNYQELIIPVEDGSKNSGGKSDFLESDSHRYKVFTFEFLIKKILDYGEDQGHTRVRQIANWGIKTKENVLRALLKNHMDQIAK